jgi:uncharacterized membrane protein HdeD (DUF308 family)
MHIGRYSVKIYWNSDRVRAFRRFRGEEFSRTGERSTFALFSNSWWALVLRGFLSISFGIAAYSWPALTVRGLLLFFGFYALVDGFVLILHAISSWSEHPWGLMIQSLIGIGIGVLIYEAPAVTTLVLVLYIAVRSLANGVLDIVALRLSGKRLGKHCGWSLLA